MNSRPPTRPPGRSRVLVPADALRTGNWTRPPASHTLTPLLLRRACTPPCPQGQQVRLVLPGDELPECTGPGSALLGCRVAVTWAESSTSDPRALVKGHLPASCACPSAATGPSSGSGAAAGLESEGDLNFNDLAQWPCREWVVTYPHLGGFPPRLRSHFPSQATGISALCLLRACPFTAHSALRPLSHSDP